MNGGPTTTVRRWSGWLALIAALGVGSAMVTHASFAHTSASAGNSFEVGTVNVGDNDTGAAVLNLTDATPGATDSGCIHVTYTGSLPADLRLYGTVTGSLAPYLTLTVTRGTDSAPSFGSCDSFTADPIDYLGSGAGVVYEGPLSEYPTGYVSGIVDPPAGPLESWTTGESHTYQLTITLGSDPAAGGLSAAAELSWEARST